MRFKPRFLIAESVNFSRSFRKADLTRLPCNTDLFNLLCAGCRLWVIRDRAISRQSRIMSAMRRKRPNFAAQQNDAMCHVWTAPGWQGFSSRMQHWSVQPCVRPLSAAHRAAGHNALRGSGPGQKHAFDNALAQVGCPDRRIDRLCITCCSPFPTFTSRRMSGAISFTPQARRVLCSARPWPSSPRPSAQSCWQERWRQPWSAAAPAMP